MKSFIFSLFLLPLLMSCLFFSLTTEKKGGKRELHSLPPPFSFLLPPWISSSIPTFPSLPLKHRIETMEGQVDDCTCDVERVDECMDDLGDVLESLSNKTFFQYFKVNYLRDCPFWEDDVMCSLESGGMCGVQPCEQDEIPPKFRAGEEVDCENREKSKVDASLPDGMEWKDRNERMWIVQDDESDEFLHYINLKLNEEKYTGYGASSGAESAAKVWKAIYLENCFSSSPDGDQCFEERVFYRLISGFHASTTAHIAENFEGQNGEKDPNLPFFIWKLGIFPERINNIYFTYLFLIRALNAAQENLISFDYGTGVGKGEEEAVRGHLEQLFNHHLVCSSPFDESSMFLGEDNKALKNTLRTKFRNISSIMDCVSCETCKVHAKLQILGIGTALRLLLDHESNNNNNNIDLQRNEVVALVNSLLKFAESIQIYQKMVEREEKFVFFSIIFVIFVISFELLVAGWVILGGLWLLGGRKKEEAKKEGGKKGRGKKDQ